MPFQPKYTFPIRQANSFELLVDGEEYFTAMLDGIKAAQNFIYLEQYLVTTGAIGKQFVQALTDAVQRGVSVYCLFDDYGSRGLTQKSRRRLVHAGIQLCFYNPVKLQRWQSALFRDHRKLLLIDNVVAFVGGAGITDDFIPKHKVDSWHDVVLKIRGEVLSDWCQLFQNTWQQISGIAINYANSILLQTEMSAAGQVLVNHPWHQEYNRVILNRMRHASKRIWISTPYFVPSWKLRRRLKRMAVLGVDVRLLLSGDRSDHPWVSQAARRYYVRLLKNHVRIFEYQPRFTHAKIVLCDDWVSIGSSNLDRWNQRWNLDANQAIENAAFAETTKQVFQNDFEQCREIHLSAWLERPWWQRWREGYAGYLVLLLEKISRYLPKRRNHE